MEKQIRNKRKTLYGVVTSDKMDKTVVVKVERKFNHPLYKKQVMSHRKYHAHDEKNQAHVGDKVKIVESRPISATKFFYVAKIMEKAK